MKKVSQTPQGTCQHYHNGVAFCKFVETLDDTAVLFQPAEHVGQQTFAAFARTATLACRNADIIQQGPFEFPLGQHSLWQ